MEPAEGVVVAGRYRLVRKLGAGGMGSVWLAHDISLDSACALKLIDDEKSKNGEVRVRFEREAKAAAQLRGAHVVDVFDHGDIDGVLYIAMEYMEGEDLGARLDRVRVLDARTTYRIIAHVCRALARAHAYGIVHRDLKPENIFLIQGDEGEIAKVLDFGIAQHDAYSLHDKATRTGSFLGTPFYVSPEQARGKPTDHRSDLWSLGIIAFQALTGRPPFESEALGELMGLILYEDLPRPTLRNPDLPPALDAWWERAAARDRERRFQSAKELSDALAVALDIDQLIMVPTIAPRRAGTSEASGGYAASTGRASFPPVPGLPADLMAGRLGYSATPAGDAADDMIETDAPVSRTRDAAIPLSYRLKGLLKLPRELGQLSSRTTMRRWLLALKEQRKRTLVVAAIVGGIALGIGITLAWVAEDEGAMVGPVPATPLGSAARRAASPHQGAEVPSAEPPLAQRAAPSAAAVEQHKIEGVPDAGRPAKAARQTPVMEPRRRLPPPPPKKRAPDKPDYGI
ncbi:MAG TPA: serine/threonine-protein kinase [Polyangiaceae bacterium]|nr:serine/threonine-protein kinase [Polyangiaceae bacterium]